MSKEPQTIEQIAEYLAEQIANDAYVVEMYGSDMHQSDIKQIAKVLVKNSHLLSTPTPNPPVLALNEAAEKECKDYFHKLIDLGFPVHSDMPAMYLDGVKFGANCERSKLPEIIKEVLKRAADQMTFIYHDGFNKTDNRVVHAQFGIDHVRVDKQSILSVFDNCDDLIK